MWSFASTPGKRFVTPRSSSRTDPLLRVMRRGMPDASGMPRDADRSLRRVVPRVHRHRAVDDPLPELLEPVLQLLRHVVVELVEVAERDAVVLERPDVQAAL